MKLRETKDFYMTGALLSKGFCLVDQNRDNGYTIFSFEDCPQLQQSISQYYLGQLSVIASANAAMLRQLKGVMHNSISTQNQENNNNEQKGQK